MYYADNYVAPVIFNPNQTQVIQNSGYVIRDSAVPSNRHKSEESKQVVNAKRAEGSELIENSEPMVKPDMDNIRKYLSRRLTKYGPIVKHGESILRLLDLIIEQEAGSLVGQRAVLAVGRIGGDRATSILERCARHTVDTIRIVTAFALKWITEEQAVPILLYLLDDKDPSVVKLAIRSARLFQTEEIRKKLMQIKKEHPYEFLRRRASAGLIPSTPHE